MGRKSNSTSTVYGNTTTTNPYAYSNTNNSGTKSGFQNGTALQSIYDFVNANADALLNEYLNPNLNSVTNKAKLNSFANTLSNQTKVNFENNIINPLSNRNMIRSSQANDMYKNLANQNVSAIANYANDLISNSQSDTAKMLGNLMNYYMLGANYLSNMQNNSLRASQGNATRYNSTENSKGDAAADMASLMMSVMLNMI